MTLGEDVRARRRELDLLQIDVAEMSGTSERFVREVERDKPGVRLDKLRDVLEVLGLELTLRIRGTGG